MSAIVWQFEHSLALPFFGIGMKTDLSSPVATAEFSKFAGILSAALSQHHLSGFGIAQLEFQDQSDNMAVYCHPADLTYMQSTS